MMRFPLLLCLAALTLPLLSGCKNPCRRLAEQLCECRDTRAERESCLQNVSQREANVDITREDEVRCAEFLETCDCEQRETPEGKQACGLAR